MAEEATVTEAPNYTEAIGTVGDRTAIHEVPGYRCQW